jgi:hypothetical protein
MMAPHFNTSTLAGAVAGVFMTVVALFCGGCSPADQQPVGSSAPGTSVSAPAITAHAVLDWDTAAITLPLEQFGMSPEESRVVVAASNIVFVRCVTGVTEKSSFPAAELSASAHVLTAPADEAEWLYSIWDALYVALHGDSPGSGVSSFSPGSTLGLSAEVARACASGPEYKGLIPITAQQLGAGVQGDSLVRYSMEASRQTRADSRAVATFEELRNCLIAAGYELYADSDLPIAVHPDGAAAREQLLISLAEATCNDDLQITQRVGDINATYEQLIIDEHEAELLAIRAEVELRLERAHQILREAGLE